MKMLPVQIRHEPGRHCQVERLAAMLDAVSDNLYRSHRFRREIFSECIWLYCRFSISFRDVEELMAARGVLVIYETILCRCDKFGEAYADAPGDDVPELATTGIWMRFSSRSTAVLTTSGKPLIRTALCSTSLCSHGGIDLRPYVSFAGCCGLLNKK